MNVCDRLIPPTDWLFGVGQAILRIGQLSAQNEPSGSHVAAYSVTGSDVVGQADMVPMQVCLTSCIPGGQVPDELTDPPALAPRPSTRRLRRNARSSAWSACSCRPGGGERAPTSIGTDPAHRRAAESGSRLDPCGEGVRP